MHGDVSPSGNYLLSPMNNLLTSLPFEYQMNHKECDWQYLAIESDVNDFTFIEVL